MFVNCEYGVNVLNSCDVEIYNNTFFNSTVCISHTARSAEDDHFGWHPASGPDVDERDGHVLVNNLFSAQNGFLRTLVYVWQPADLCTRIPDLLIKQIDHNVYIREDNNKSIPLILWSPAKNDPCQLELSTPDELTQKVDKKYAYHSILRIKPLNTIFKSTELGNFELIEDISNSDGVMLPGKVYKMLKIDRSKSLIKGAYLLFD